jgi:hypothetical protein
MLRQLARQVKDENAYEWETRIACKLDYRLKLRELQSDSGAEAMRHTLHLCVSMELESKDNSGTAVNSRNSSRFRTSLQRNQRYIIGVRGKCMF